MNNIAQETMVRTGMTRTYHGFFYREENKIPIWLLANQAVNVSKFVLEAVRHVPAGQLACVRVDPGEDHRVLPAGVFQSGAGDAQAIAQRGVCLLYTSRCV